MDKKVLSRVNDSMKRIKTNLLLNDKIRQLLCYDEINSSTGVPLIEQVAGHIFIQPIIDVDVKEPFNKKNYITITFPEGDKAGNKMDYVVRIIVMCDKSGWDLNGDARPLLIAQEVVNTLDNFETSFSNRLVFDSIVETVTSKDIVGYSLLFNVADGISDINEE